MKQDVAVRALLDGNVLDLLADDTEALQIVTEALNEGRLELVQTHLLVDELEPMADRAKWAQLEALRVRLQGRDAVTAGAVLDVSRADAARLLDEDEVEQFERLTAGNPKHAEDAMLALTARDLDAVLITADKRLAKRARELAVNVCDLASFVQQLKPLLDQ